MTAPKSVASLDRREACAYYHLSEGRTFEDVAKHLGSSKFKVSTDLQRWQRANDCVFDVGANAADRVGVLRPATAAVLSALLSDLVV